MVASISARPLAADILAEAGYKNARPPEADVKPSIVLPDLSAESKEDNQFRAYFLAMAISSNHRLMLSTLIERLNLSLPADELKEKLNLSTKILTCASLFLIGLESGGTANRSCSIDLLIGALHAVERLSQTVSVRELLAVFGDNNPESLDQILCRKVARVFALDSQMEESIANFVGSEIAYRRGISRYACSQSVFLLREQLALFV